MNGKYWFSLIAVVILMLLAYVGAEAGGLAIFFGIVITFSFIDFFFGVL